MEFPEHPPNIPEAEFIENYTELEIEQEAIQEYNAEKEFQFLEDVFNLNIQDEIRKLKLHNITQIKGWLKYNSTVVVNLQAGTVLNLYLMGPNKRILFDSEIWKMIRHCLSSADKRRMQTSSSLVVMEKALEFKLDFYREHHKGRLIKAGGKELVIDLLPKTRVRMYESANVTVTLVDTVTKLSSSVTLPYEQYQQAKYAAGIDLARKVKLLEMEKEA